MSNRELLKGVLAAADRDSEIYLSTNREIEISAFNGAVNNFTMAESSGAGARVVDGGRSGAAFTESISADSLSAALAAASGNAAYSAVDAGNVLYGGGEITGEANGQVDALRGISAADKKQVALDVERLARAYDKRIVNVPYAYYQEVTGEVLLASTSGTLAERQYAYCGGMVYLVASDGSDTQVGSAMRLTAAFEGISIEDIVQEAAEKALRMLGAGSIESGSPAMVLDEAVAGSLLGAFICSGGSHFYGENIQKNRSRLRGERGEPVGCANFTLIDDPHAGTIRSRPFDAEGVPTSRCTVVEKGSLVTVPYSVYAAARAESKILPTGHGRRGGYAGGISTGFHDIFIPDGTDSREALLGMMGEGLLITNLEGLHSGLDPITGDFSLAAKGFRVSGGSVGAPVRNFTVAGNFFDLITHIEAVGNDRREYRSGTLSSPSLLVTGLSVSS